MVAVLMTVNQEAWLTTLAVVAERTETSVRLTVRFVVDAQRRVMCHENVRRWKIAHRTFDFSLMGVWDSGTSVSAMNNPNISHQATSPPPPLRRVRSTQSSKPTSVVARR